MIGPHWVVPTTRTVRAYLLGIGAVATTRVLAGLVAGTQGVALPATLVWVLAAAVAVAAAVPHDPLAGLVAATPTGPARRVAQRVTVTILAAVVAWLLAGRILRALAEPAEPVVTAPALLALACVAVAATRWLGPWGACAPLAIVSLSRLAGDSGIGVLDLWRTHPWVVVVAAVLTTVARLRRTR